MSHNYDFPSRKREGIKVLTFTPGPSLTIQSHKTESDINHIISRFQRTGELPSSGKTPQYSDISEIQQLDSTTALANARATIETVKSDVQKHRAEQQKIQKQQEREQLINEIRQELIAQGTPPPNAAV